LIAEYCNHEHVNRHRGPEIPTNDVEYFLVKHASDKVSPKMQRHRDSGMARFPESFASTGLDNEVFERTDWINRNSNYISHCQGEGIRRHNSGPGHQKCPEWKSVVSI